MSVVLTVTQPLRSPVMMDGNVVVYQDVIRAEWDLRSAAPVDMLPG